MVRKLMFFATCLISTLLISSCGANNHSIGQSGGNDQSGGSNVSPISITAPNNGVSFSIRESDSVTISGICEKVRKGQGAQRKRTRPQHTRGQLRMVWFHSWV